MSIRGKEQKQRFQTLQEAESFLNSRIDLERLVKERQGRMSLGPMLSLMEALDHPERSFRSVHVAGTYGKGSTSHFIAAFLRRLGFRVGLYTSPHLERITERIQVDGKEISGQGFASAVFVGADLCSRPGGHGRPPLQDPGGRRGPPLQEAQGASYFDLLTAAAFLHFRGKVDWAVIEVGLGGRLDSTNVIVPELSIITSIGSDHSDVLGSSLAQKAREKAGIIKPGVPVLSGVEDPESAEIIRAISQELDSPFHSVSGLTDPRLLSLGLARYQSRNLSLAFHAIEILGKKHGWNLDRYWKGDAKDFFVPGRFERIPGEPEMILDGAHMPEAIAALVESLGEISSKTPHVAVFAAAADKDIPGMLKSLKPWADTVILTAAQTPRAVALETLTLHAKELGIAAKTAKNCEEALKLGRQLAKGGRLLVTGSMYLVGEARNLLL